ncbi:hypothetical protein CEXT_394671 [Caerostris extrusa]|uniref:Uncharacterized protein n=1 Tax=Caerostris extrusa TaxID=172846 RepID=A0AAV4VL46_CAEEX|nr:hypothetical protein CEXT_394671 [Caerostris extrusa]
MVLALLERDMPFFSTKGSGDETERVLEDCYRLLSKRAKWELPQIIGQKTITKLSRPQWNCISWVLSDGTAASENRKRGGAEM